MLISYLTVMKQTKIITLMILINILIGQFLVYSQQCQPCYSQQHDTKCESLQEQNDYVLHFSFHPHLDAFWIYDFQKYYDPLQVGNKRAMHENYFSSVRSIFDTITVTLDRSRKYRQQGGQKSQKAHRSFFNSQIGFFKRWYTQQSYDTKQKVRKLLNTKYWEILGGGYVEHDQGCAYYQDIIQNFDLGLSFLKNQFNYHPKIAISADSFGHSQSTLAILAHLGIEGFFVERSDEHIIENKKTQFIWKATSANSLTYGALPTHIRWAIHGYQNQFDQTSFGKEMCYDKERYYSNLRQQNQFLKKILNSTHIMRYFGHDFQKFNDYSYEVAESIMEKFSMEHCNKVIAVYGNPTQYFQALVNEVQQKSKPISFRNSDIFPIWDYDSGLYWTGYFTTDPYHKKIYRDSSRFLYAVRKFYLPYYIKNQGSEHVKQTYQLLEQFAQHISYLQHHDGISGTSKYSVLDSYEQKSKNFQKRIQDFILQPIFDEDFPLDSSSLVLNCGVFEQCQIPETASGDILLKIFNSGGDLKANTPIKIHMPENQFYYTKDCEYQSICTAHSLPCSCTLYLYPNLFTYKTIRLYKTPQPQKAAFLNKFVQNTEFSINSTHFKIKIEDKQYGIGYKKIVAESTSRSYEHLSRYGKKVKKSFTINSGKYALGNNPITQESYSSIRKVYQIDSAKITQFIIKWKRQSMKTIITINKSDKTCYKVQTLQSADNQMTRDIYLEITSPIQSQKKFYTDSNGWLVMERELFTHQDYQAQYSKQGYDNINGNSYPMTAFAFIKDNSNKLSIHTDRPQGVISPRNGVLWVNIDRITFDDGKWVYEKTYRNQYQKFTHHIFIGPATLDSERKQQLIYDQPLLIQGAQIESQQKLQTYDDNIEMRQKWTNITNIDKIKFWIRPRNNSQTTVRIQNLNDKQNITVSLLAGGISPLLTSYYGRIVRFQEVREMSLGANMDYQQFIKNKWKTDLNLTNENDIFNKDFKENITLRPLEIRTFSFNKIFFDSRCIGVQDLKYTLVEHRYRIQNFGGNPSRLNTSLEKKILDYLNNGDHCKQESPVLYRRTMNEFDINFNSQNPVEYPQHQQVALPKSIEIQQIPQQKMPKDVQESNIGFYSKISQIKKKPLTVQLKKKIKIEQIYSQQPIRDQPIIPDIYQKDPNNIYDNKDNSIDNQRPIKNPTYNPNLIITKNTVPIVIVAIKQKIQMNFMLTKSQKQQYFSWKYSQISNEDN